MAAAETGDFPTRADSTAETINDEEKLRLERAAIGGLLEPFDDGLGLEPTSDGRCSSGRG